MGYNQPPIAEPGHFRKIFLDLAPILLHGQMFRGTAKFILFFFKYNFLRRLEAHEIPIDIKLSKDKKKAFIPQKGNKQDAEMDIEEIKKIKNTYGFFIEATRICEH